MKEPLDPKKVWATRILTGGAIYYLLGGREMRVAVAGAAVLYLVNKKYIPQPEPVAETPKLEVKSPEIPPKEQSKPERPVTQRKSTDHFFDQALHGR